MTPLHIPRIRALDLRRPNADQRRFLEALRAVEPVTALEKFRPMVFGQPIPPDDIELALRRHSRKRDSLSLEEAKLLGTLCGPMGRV